jgi:hypothetical protein
MRLKRYKKTKLRLQQRRLQLKHRFQLENIGRYSMLCFKMRFQYRTEIQRFKPLIQRAYGSETYRNLPLKEN